MSVSFLPAVRMIDRAQVAKEESDTAYFFDLLYQGEFLLKTIVIELLAALQEDREKHRYALEYELVRADSIGKWTDVLDQILSGPASQHLVPQGRESQQAISMSFGPQVSCWQRRAVDLLNCVCRLLDPEYEDTTRQKVSLRTWTRQFSWLRNRTRGHGAPRGAVLSSICSPLSSSLLEILENAPAFQRSWAYLRQSLSGKFRVSQFGSGREEFSYLAREKEHSFPDGSYVFLDGPRPAHLIATDPDLTDFFHPNGNFRNGSFETLSYITDSRRQTDGSAYLLPVEAQPRSQTRATPKMEVVGNAFTNMPPQPESYIRRLDLEGSLDAILFDDRHPVITLQGRGGIGKTSLALKVLHKAAASGDVFGIVWFSARDIDLLPEGPKVVRADVLTIDDIAVDFSRLMLESPLKTDKARQYFADHLCGQAQDGPFIFVFDNFETIREQAELYQFVSNSVRLPNKVLITTRTRDFKADYPILVDGMKPDEFAKLITATSAKLGIVDLIDAEYAETLRRESDGHPYIAKVLLGEIAKAGHRVTVRRVVAAKDAMLDALFDRSYESLSSVAQRVFLTLCSWRSMVPRLGLEAVLLRPGNDHLDVEASVRELEQSSLIEVAIEDGGKQEFLSVPLAASLFGKRKLVTSPFKIAIDSDLEIIRSFGTITTTDLAHGLSPRVERVARSAAARAENGEDITQELEVIEYIATGYQDAWLILAELYRDQLSDVTSAIRAVGRYVENRPGDKAGWVTLISLHRADKNPLAEMNARLQLAELARPDFSDLSEAAHRLNGLLSRRELSLDVDGRRLTIRKLRNLLEARSKEATATDLSRLAWLCMYDQDTETAGQWVAKGLELEPDNDHCLSLQRRLGAGSSGV